MTIRDAQYLFFCDVFDPNNGKVVVAVVSCALLQVRMAFRCGVASATK